MLPLLVQKDLGKTAVFGGGGYEIDPGPGNRDFWIAGLALTHEASKTLSIGAEVSWQSADIRPGKSSTGLNIGLIQKLGGVYSVLLAAGPSFAGAQSNYHVYTALALNY